MEVATNSDRAAHTSALISAFKSNAWIEHGTVHPQVTHMSIGRQLTNLSMVPETGGQRPWLPLQPLQCHVLASSVQKFELCIQLYE